jgi:hypothetical protein
MGRPVYDTPYHARARARNKAAYKQRRARMTPAELDQFREKHRKAMRAYLATVRDDPRHAERKRAIDRANWQRVKQDPQRKQRRNAVKAARNRARWRNDPEYRARRLAQQRQQKARRAARRGPMTEAQKAKARERYQHGRDKQLAYQRRYAQSERGKALRLASDRKRRRNPARLAYQAEYQRRQNLARMPLHPATPTEAERVLRLTRGRKDLTPEQRAARQRAYMFKYRRKAEVIQRMREYRHSMHGRATRQLYMQRQRETLGEAEVRRRHADKQRRSYAKKMAAIRADPVALAAWNKLRAERNQRWREKLERTAPEKWAKLRQRELEHSRQPRTEEQKARQRANYRARMARIYADPQRHAEYKARHNAYTLQLRERRAIAKPQNATAMAATLNKLMPANMPAEQREELRAVLVAAIWAGDTTVERLQAGALKKYATQVWDLMPIHERRTVSLDAEIPGTDGMRRIDVLASDTPHF